MIANIAAFAVSYRGGANDSCPYSCKMVTICLAARVVKLVDTRDLKSLAG